MSRFFPVLPYHAGLLALAALSVVLLSGTARADTDTDTDAEFVTEFRTLHAGLCPEERANAVGPNYTCSTAKILYIQMPKKPWLDHLVAKSVILPMFSEALGKKQLPPLAPGKDVKARYLELLKDLVRSSSDNAHDKKDLSMIDFSASLAGCDENNRSQEADSPWPEHFGPLLQLCLSYTLSREGEAHPPGPSGGSIVIDTGKHKILTFGDLILPGQEKALETLQRKAFRAYLKAQDGMTDAAAIEEHLTAPTFAFHLSKNWRIAKDGGLIFGYAMYEIGPRTLGTPEIFIAKHELQGIVQPGILAHIP
ncbi:MAG: RsiV family protein [Azoarcus sp.]|nr:RsiV family protein [Azoarcus sp.]